MNDVIKSADNGVYISPEMLFALRLIIITFVLKTGLVLFFRIDWFKIKWTRFLRKYRKEHYNKKDI